MTPYELVQAIKAEFQAALSAKTGWGRNEIMQAFDSAVSGAILKLAAARFGGRLEGSQ